MGGMAWRLGHHTLIIPFNELLTIKPTTPQRPTTKQQSLFEMPKLGFKRGWPAPKADGTPMCHCDSMSIFYI